MKSFIQKKSPYIELADIELLNQTQVAAANEKSATLVLLEYLSEVDRRRLYCTKSYSTLFEYVVKELGYSTSAASDRVNAVRLMRAVPEVKQHLEEGRMTLTSASQIQRFYRAEVKAANNQNSESDADSQVRILPEMKILVEACLDLSSREVERTLLIHQTEPARILSHERVKLVSVELSEVKFLVNQQFLTKLEELKSLVGNRSLPELFEQSLNALIQIEQKKRGRLKDSQSLNAPEIIPGNDTDSISRGISVKPRANRVVRKSKIQNPNSRFVPIDLKRLVFKRSNGRCEYLAGKNKKRCESKFRLQIDHVVPFAMGGATIIENLRHLCVNHNLKSAENWGLGELH